MKKNLIVTIIVAIVVGALGFYGGIQYQKSQRGSFSANPQRFFNGMGMKRAPSGLVPVNGEVTSFDGNTITVKTQNGGSKIVIYSDSTKINKTTEGSKSDIKVGENVMVFGSTGSDGTVVAQTVAVGSRMQGPGEDQSKESAQ